MPFDCRRSTCLPSERSTELLPGRLHPETSPLTSLCSWKAACVLNEGQRMHFNVHPLLSLSCIICSSLLTNYPLTQNNVTGTPWQPIYPGHNNLCQPISYDETGVSLQYLPPLDLSWASSHFLHITEPDIKLLCRLVRVASGDLVCFVV